MITILNRYAGTTAMPSEDPALDRVELMCLAADIPNIADVGNASVAYAIDEGKLYVYDEENEAWYDEDGNAFSSGGGEE